MCGPSGANNRRGLVTMRPALAPLAMTLVTEGDVARAALY